MAASDLQDELLLLEAMYPNELVYDKAKSQISIQLKPNTAMDSSKQFVQCTLVFQTNEDYPNTLPDITITQERGISEADKQSMIQRLIAKAKEELIGTPMLFSLIEEAKELLTTSNKPSEDCSICLCPFELEDDETTILRTPCFHYFHRDCFESWWRKGTKNCPVCRRDIKGDESFIVNAGLSDIVEDRPEEAPDSVVESYQGLSAPDQIMAAILNSLGLPMQTLGELMTEEAFEETEEEREERIERERIEEEGRRPVPILVVQYKPPQHLVENGFIESRKSPTAIKQLFVPFGCTECKAKVTTMSSTAALDSSGKAEVFIVKFGTLEQALFAHANFRSIQSTHDYLTCSTISNNNWESLSTNIVDPEIPYQDPPVAAVNTTTTTPPTLAPTPSNNKEPTKESKSRPTGNRSRGSRHHYHPRSNPQSKPPHHATAVPSSSASATSCSHPPSSNQNSNSNVSSTSSSSSRNRTRHHHKPKPKPVAVDSNQ